MLDPKYVRSYPEEVAQLLRKKHYCLDVDRIKALEEARRSTQIQTEQLQAENKSGAKEFAKLKKNNEDISRLQQKMQAVKAKMQESEQKLQEIQQEVNNILLQAPNLPDNSVPEGKDEEDNQLVSTWGDKPLFDFIAKDHVDLGADLMAMDFAKAAQISGSRFVALTGPLARLHRALAQFMLTVHTEQHGYTEVYTPYLVNAQTLMGSGQLPKFEEDLFKVVRPGQADLYLIPTAEVPLANFARDTILDNKELPIKLTAHSPCFRSEAGSYGRDVRGMLRQHQFDKVELVQIVSPEESFSALETLTSEAEFILQQLKLPYRKVLLCGGDLGFSAHKTYDLEVWLPGQNRYREISSCSNCGNFQARRMNTRWRKPDTGKAELVHTLNGSGIAVGRALIAVMENYQDAKGNIKVPEVLQDFMGETSLIQNSGQ